MATKKKPQPKRKPKVKAKPKEKSKGGRPTKYKPEYAEEAYRLCLLGARDIDLAGVFAVDPDTINEWKKKFPEFSESITRGKHPADGFVASALYERAKGCEWQEEIAIKYKTGKGTQEAVKVVTVTRRAPPDTPAIIFWLKNRQRKAWRDKVDHAALDQKKADAPQRISFKMDKDIQKEDDDV